MQHGEFLMNLFFDIFFFLDESPEIFWPNRAHLPMSLSSMVVDWNMRDEP